MGEPVAGGLVVNDGFPDELRLKRDYGLNLVVGERGTDFLDGALGAELHQAIALEVAKLLVISDKSAFAAGLQREQVLAIKAAGVTDAQQPQQRRWNVDLAQSALDARRRYLRGRVDPERDPVPER